LYFFVFKLKIAKLFKKIWWSGVSHVEKDRTQLFIPDDAFISQKLFINIKSYSTPKKFYSTMHPKIQHRCTFLLSNNAGEENIELLFINFIA
jgi:hypothetical protein